MRRIRTLLPTTAALLSLAACSLGSETAGTTPSAVQTTTSAVETTVSLVDATEPEPESNTTTTPPICSSPPQDEVVIVALPAWEVGIERSLELRSTKDRDGFAGESVTPINLKVIADTDDGWIMDWQWGSTSVEIGGFDPTQIGEAESFLEEIPTLRLEYELDQSRVFVGLRNHDEIRQGLAETFSVMGDLIEDDTFDVATSFYDRMSDEQLGIAVSEDVIIFHFFENIFLQVDDQLKFQEPLPNVLGGEPFPAITTIQILELADQDGCVVLEAVTIPDPDMLGPIIEASLSLAFPDFTEDQTIEFSETFHIENRVTARYDYGSTFLHEVSAIQTITLGSETRVESTVIADVTP